MKKILIGALILMILGAWGALELREAFPAQTEEIQTYQKMEGKVVDVYTFARGVYPNVILLKVEFNTLTVKTRTTPVKETTIPLDQIKAITVSR